MRNIVMRNLKIRIGVLKPFTRTAEETTKLKSLKNLDIYWNHITHNLDFLPTEIKVNRAWNR